MTKFKQLRLVYEKIYTTTTDIAALIEKKEFDKIHDVVKAREPLSNLLSRAKISLSADDVIPADLEELIQKIDVLEQKNLEILQLVQLDLKSMMDSTKNKNKINSVYAPIENKPMLIDTRE